jgi:hypothetical protein
MLLDLVCHNLPEVKPLEQSDGGIILTAQSKTMECLELLNEKEISNVRGKYSDCRG